MASLTNILSCLSEVEAPNFDSGQLVYTEEFDLLIPFLKEVSLDAACMKAIVKFQLPANFRIDPNKLGQFFIQHSVEFNWSYPIYDSYTGEIVRESKVVSITLSGNLIDPRIGHYLLSKLRK